MILARRFRACALFGLWGVLPLAAAFAQQAGHVLTVAGVARLERDGVTLPLQAGTPVQSGDILEVGEGGAMQVRLSDESIMALRANSRLKIGDYRFNRDANTDRSFVSLLRGGMRTITGLIGKANPRQYGVITNTAALGIRGTHFTIVLCQDDCDNPDGTKPANGLFGGVTDGRVSATNQAGEEEFGQQEYFYIASATSAAERLLVPPPVLSDRALIARARAAARAAAEGREGDGRFARRAALAVSTSPIGAGRTLPAAVIAMRSAAASIDNPAVAGALTSFTGALAFVDAHGDASGQASVAVTQSRVLTLAQARQEAPQLADLGFFNAATLAMQLGKFEEVHARPAAGVYWLYRAPDAAGTNPLGTHLAWGDMPAVSLPGAGQAVYAFAGGTSPTDNFGRTGVLSAGRLGMDFQARQVRALDALTLQFAPVEGKVTGTTYAIPAQSTWNLEAGVQRLATLQCQGCSGAQGTINGRLVGAGWQGYVTAIGVEGMATTRAGPVRHIAGAAATFGRQ